MIIFHILASSPVDWHKRQPTGLPASSLAHAPAHWRSRQPTGGIASSWHLPPVYETEIHNCGVVVVTVKWCACNNIIITARPCRVGSCSLDLAPGRIHA